MPSDWRTVRLKNETREAQKGYGCLPTAAVTGCLGSWIGLSLIFFGGLCSLTGIGAIIGIPMIIAGVTFLGGSPFASAFFGMVASDAIKEEAKQKEAELNKDMVVEAGGVVPINELCPWCLTGVSSDSNAKRIRCPTCGERIIVSDRKYLRG